MGSSKKAHDATRQERKAKKRKLEEAVPDLPGDNDSADIIYATSEKTDKKRKRDVEAEDGLNDEAKERRKRKKEEKRRRKEETGEINGEMRKVEGGKKENQSKKDEKEEPATVEPNVEVEGVAVEGPKKSKKERKAERRTKEAAEAAKNDTSAVQLEAPVEKKTNEASGEEEKKKKSKKNNRNREKKRKGTSTDGASVNGNADQAEVKDKKDAKFICFIGTSPTTLQYPSDC